MATVIQFPVRLAHAITAHKIQGNTIPYPSTVLIDLSSVFEAAQAYVMLSRVQCIDQVLIYKSLDEKKIRTSPVGLEELSRLKKISMNENPTAWNEDKQDLRVAFLNCAGLIPHLEDIKADNKILKADVVHLDETHIQGECSIEVDGYNGHYVNVGNGKGIATFRKTSVDATTTLLKLSTLQIVKVSMLEIDSVNVYRSSSHSIIETSEAINSFIDPDKVTIITGDFNICFSKKKTNAISTDLERKGFSQLQMESSHIKGGVIDHVYWHDPTSKWNLPILERHTVWYSDHDAILISLSKKPVKRSKLSKRTSNKKQRVI